MQNTMLNILITVDKTCEKVLSLKVEHNLNNKIKRRKFSFLVGKPYNKKLLTSTSVDIRIINPVSFPLI